ncbi:MAG: glucose 1-dehydrogenase [Alphaproteobacteria bacterium]
MTISFSAAGRVALVTGSTRGIGLAMARALAEQGAIAVLHGRNEADAEARAAELRADGLQAVAVGGDLAEPENTRALVPAAIAKAGKVDILINNAGAIHRAELAEHTEADWRHVVEVNLNATFLLCQAAAGDMRPRGWGRIINTASIHSVSSRPTIPAYVSTKHAINGLTKALATELGSTGITVNAIGPGYIDTEFNAALINNESFDAMVKSRTPVGRWGHSDDMAGAAVFLASDAAAYVNGHLLVVDGGMTTALY